MSQSEVYAYLNDKEQKNIWFTGKEIHTSMNRTANYSTTTILLNKLYHSKFIERKRGNNRNTYLYRVKPLQQKESKGLLNKIGDVFIKKVKQNNRTGVMKRCVFCKKKFFVVYIRRKKAKYCSIECSYKDFNTFK